MSLKSFLRGIFNAIENIFKSLPNEAKQGVNIGTQIVDLIKNYQGEITSLTQLIPGTVDDKVSAAIQKELPIIVQDLQLVTNLKGETDPIKLINAARDVLKSLTGKTAQWEFYDSLATQIGTVATMAMSDGKKIWGDVNEVWNDIKYTVKWFKDHKAGTAVTTVQADPLPPVAKESIQ
jgi:hypothetical protein